MDVEQPPAYTPSNGQTYQAALPSYQDIERQNAPPPPSYESLYGRAKAIREESSGSFDFVKRLTCMCVGTIGFTIFLGIMLVIPIAMIVIGAIYKNDCPKEKFIPIYLIVAGSFGLVRNIFSIIRRCLNRDEEAENNNKNVNPVESIIDCFMFAWFIAGNVWIYRIYGNFSENSAEPNFCDPTLYWFSFWIITSFYIILGCTCFCCCCCGMLAICLEK